MATFPSFLRIDLNSEWINKKSHKQQCYTSFYHQIEKVNYFTAPFFNLYLLTKFLLICTKKMVLHRANLSDAYQ